jgi:hypothetical protein
MREAVRCQLIEWWGWTQGWDGMRAAFSEDDTPFALVFWFREG